MQIRTEFPYETAREDLCIPLPDGVRLYARIWRPVTDEPVPALLEYLPNRLSDRTAPRDWQRHPWYAGHGYASVRVDVRGHGNSEGIPGDPHGATAPADGVAVVHWLARQEWCSGRVGMFGIGRGGQNALRIAALAPEPLKAVVSVCSADDGFGNDAHYLGGAVLAAATHARSAALLASMCCPPDPADLGDDWRRMWLERLESVEPMIHTWLAHQTRDDYWKQSGIREHLAAITAPVLAVGGWHDPHRDTVLRLIRQLGPALVRGIIGPWSHQYPDRGVPPGPWIGFLQETLRWWDQHLRGQDTGVMNEPLLRSWMSGSYPPAAAYPTLPGRWVGDAAWPSPDVTPVEYALRGAPQTVRSPQQTGVDAGAFRPLGHDADLPPDQRGEDAGSLAFEFPVEGSPIEILGTPRVRLRIRMDVPHGQVIARLCDVAPDGSSTLVTRGALDLSARNGPDRCDEWPVGEYEDVEFGLLGIGHTFPPGHRIRLALSSAYWPWIWPRAESAGFVLDPAGSLVELPVRAHTEDPAISFGEPEQSEPLGVVHPATLDERRPERLVLRDVATGEWRTRTDPRPGGTRLYPDGLEHTEDAAETYTIQEDDPLSARAHARWSVRLHRPELLWDVTVETHSGIGADADGFFTSDEVVCRDGDEIVFHRTWEKRIPRAAG